MRFTRIAKKADRLLETISGWWQELPVGYILSEDSYGRLIVRLADTLKLDDITCIYSSYMSYICSQVTKKSLYNLCYNISANLDRFKAGMTIPYNSIGYENSKEEFHILGIPEKIESRLKFRIRTMTGVKACHEEQISIFTSSASQWSYACGCYGRKYDVHDTYSSLSNAYIILAVTPMGTAARSLEDCDVKPVSDPNVTTFNRKNLYKYRFSLEECPKDMPGFGDIDNYCVFQCPYGYKSCSASSHEYDYPKGDCLFCNRKDVYLLDNGCIECRGRNND